MQAFYVQIIIIKKRDWDLTVTDSHNIILYINWNWDRNENIQLNVKQVKVCGILM